jgi:dihydrofolate synthase/folylpolyglutamate synthase
MADLSELSFEQTIDYLFKQLPMYQRQGKAAYKADLKNTEALMELLNHPHRNFKSIHVGGTNGKGSTSHMLASILQEASYKVGLYTSPHLLDFRERIRINGDKISQQFVVDFVRQHKTNIEAIQLSFFEWTVGLAFQYFKEQEVDIAIIEVGMGGRLDSTNVISPILSIITNIGLDHTQFLGDTKTKIAGEKAGIIKPNTPIIIGRADEQSKPVFDQKALEKQAPISYAEQVNQLNFYDCDLLGNYQLENQKTVLAALPYLEKRGMEISEKSLSNGFKNIVKNTGLLGRWQITQNNPTVVCDTAHNEDGLLAVLKQLKDLPKNNLHIVLGMVNDKAVEDILKLFPQKAQYYFCKPNIPRGLDVGELYHHAVSVGLIGDVFPSVKEAYTQALSNSKSDDVIYVGGSTFVVADFLEFIG